MKKLFLTLLILAMAVPAFGAGTIVRDTETPQKGVNGETDTWVITYTVTWDASAAAPANIALKNIVDSNGKTQASTIYNVKSWWLQYIDWNYGATGPTNDTDLHLWRIEDRIDVLGNEGVDAIDNASSSSIFPLTQTRFLTGDEIIDLDNNSVNSATGTLKLYLYR